MKNHIIILVLGFSCLLQIGCDNCNRVRCENDSGTIQIRIKRNGENAIFGDAAFINRDSIKYFKTEPILQDFSVAFHEETQSIGLNVTGGSKYFLQLSNLRTDTFTATFLLTGMGECCAQYELVAAQMNSHDICNDNCGEITEIEI